MNQIISTLSILEEGEVSLTTLEDHTDSDHTQKPNQFLTIS